MAPRPSLGAGAGAQERQREHAQHLQHGRSALFQGEALRRRPSRCTRAPAWLPANCRCRRKHESRYHERRSVRQFFTFFKEIIETKPRTENMIAL